MSWAYIAVQYITVQYSTLQYSTVHYSTVQYITVQVLALRYSYSGVGSGTYFLRKKISKVTEKDNFLFCCSCFSAKSFFLTFTRFPGSVHDVKGFKWSVRQEKSLFSKPKYHILDSSAFPCTTSNSSHQVGICSRVKKRVVSKENCENTS